MGCGATKQGKVEFGQSVVPSEKGQHKRKERRKTREAAQADGTPGKGQQDNPDESVDHGQKADKKNRKTSDSELPGKLKYMPAPIVNEAREAKDDLSGKILPGVFHVSAFSHLSDVKGLTLAVREPNGWVHAAEFTDTELQALKAERCIKHSWMSFFRSLNSALVKGQSKVKRSHDGSFHLGLTLSSTKEPKHQQLLVDLAKVGAGSDVTHQYFFDPFTKFYAKQNAGAARRSDVEIKYWKAEAVIEKHAQTIETCQLQTADVQDKLRIRKREVTDLKIRLHETLRKQKRAQSGAVHFLDQQYNAGGARTFAGHVRHATSHEPHEISAVPRTLAMIENKFLPGCKVDTKELDEKQLELFNQLERIDKWDYDVFAVDAATGGASLFHTAYALLHKYNLIEHFGIPKDVAISFLTAVQAGYRPNSYHNSTHAADVLQVTHFVMGPAGLTKLAQLSKEDLLASLLAATIHDYDHPGFNNNFHTRTSAYLATLYSDRSILENHHCACVFELMCNAKYDVLASLGEEQRREVRDTIIELVLSTDMGNHAKLFSSFRRRLQESDDWVTKREDAKLAMVMAIKMADISNCGRPSSLYLRWARNIANEFYVQGDVEQSVKLSISPFMDRRRDKTDFAKGQISFINFIVTPLFESMTELLPGMEFAVSHCQDNRERWLTSGNEGSGALDGGS
ncbi:putative 3prime [Diplonema papillatum]|nr:putative 3prime [Diplonema papillatum]